MKLRSETPSKVKIKTWRELEPVSNSITSEDFTREYYIMKEFGNKKGYNINFNSEPSTEEPSSEEEEIPAEPTPTTEEPSSEEEETLAEPTLTTEEPSSKEEEEAEEISAEPPSATEKASTKEVTSAKSTSTTKKKSTKKVTSAKIIPTTKEAPTQEESPIELSPSQQQALNEGSGHDALATYTQANVEDLIKLKSLNKEKLSKFGFSATSVSRFNPDNINIFKNIDPNILAAYLGVSIRKLAKKLSAEGKDKEVASLKAASNLNPTFMKDLTPGDVDVLLFIEGDSDKISLPFMDQMWLRVPKKLTSLYSSAAKKLQEDSELAHLDKQFLAKIAYRYEQLCENAFNVPARPQIYKEEMEKVKVAQTPKTVRVSRSPKILLGGKVVQSFNDDIMAKIIEKHKIKELENLQESFTRIVQEGKKRREKIESQKVLSQYLREPISQNSSRDSISQHSSQDSMTQYSSHDSMSQQFMHDPITRQQMMNDSTTRQQMMNESTTRQQMMNDPTILQQMMNDPTILQQMMNDSTTRQRMMNNPTILQQMMNDSTTRQQMMNNPITRQQMMNDPITRQQMMNNPITRQQMMNDPTILQQMMNDSTTRQQIRHEPITQKKVRQEAEMRGHSTEPEQNIQAILQKIAMQQASLDPQATASKESFGSSQDSFDTSRHSMTFTNQKMKSFGDQHYGRRPPPDYTQSQRGRNQESRRARETEFAGFRILGRENILGSEIGGSGEGIDKKERIEGSGGRRGSGEIEIERSGERRRRGGLEIGVSGEIEIEESGGRRGRGGRRGSGESGERGGRGWRGGRGGRGGFETRQDRTSKVDEEDIGVKYEVGKSGHEERGGRREEREYQTRTFRARRGTAQQQNFAEMFYMSQVGHNTRGGYGYGGRGGKGGRGRRGGME